MDNIGLGLRIAKLRNIKGISQDDLSKIINLSRSSLVQLEQGNRNIKVSELKSLAEVLNFSMDEIMSENYTINENIDSRNIEEKQSEIRITIADINMQKFKNLILYILERCAGKPNVGETVLYKLLYFSDFKVDYCGFAQKRYMPLVESNLKLFNGAEIEVIDNVINLLSGMSATDISHYSHEDMPWKASKEMDEIDYELAFYRTAPYSVRTYNDSEDYD